MLSTQQPEQLRRNDSLQQSYDSFISRVTGLASNVSIYLDLNLSLVKANDPLADLLKSDLLRYQSSISSLAISIILDAQAFT